MGAGVAKSGRKRQMAEINVVPYIDVMLVLLVIFMITAPVITRGIEVEKPKASNTPTKLNKTRPLEVTIDQKGNMEYRAAGGPVQYLNEAELATKAKDDIIKYKNSPVLVRGHKKAKYKDVIKAMAILKTAGAESIGLVTDTQ